MLRFFTLALLLGSFFLVQAQTHTPRYISMSSKTKGYYEYLPEGYDANGTATYPVILFMTGIGEFGNGSASQLPSVLVHGVPQVIDQGKFPTSFTVGGQVFKFIVITPQWIKFPRPEAEDMDSVLNYIVAHYKVDLNRVYITGLSYGGGMCWAYTGNNATYAKRIAAIVPVASPIPDGGDTTIYARSRVIAASNLPVWATHNLRDQDDTVATTITYINDINQAPAPTPLARMTLFNASGHDAWTRTYDPAKKEFDGLNVYEWLLQNKRNIVAANKPPTANAGSDQNITLPTNSITLSGTGSDPDGSITAYNWTKVSGPATGAITTPNAASTSVTGLVQGSYMFRLTVTDNTGATATDDVTVVVNAAPNGAPQANAGPDQTITLPVNSVTLNGSGTDKDGSIASYAWTKVSGPTSGTITSPAAAATTVTGLAEGSYVFRLTVTDNNGATGSDDVAVTVNAAPNQSPTANAGADQVITLPTNSVTLTGTGKDPDGTIASVAWTKVSGPAGGNLTTPSGSSTTVTSLQQGSYVFRLTVTDNDGASASDDVTVVVNAAPNKLPQANAGADITITLPVNSVQLNGSGTDSDGSISSYSWTKVSGPSAGAITDPAAKNTTVTGLTEGTYTFRLTVTDNDGATASDDVIITVNAAPNKLPQANAGPDQSITLPENSVQLSGSGTDADGTISSYSWTKVSGPDNGTIASPDKAATTVSDLVQGVYTFRLTVTDNDGATAFDDVVITVNAAANKTPHADAGTDVTITLPTNTATLSGSGTDEDGNITTYAWTKVSGPAGGTITTLDAATTTVTDLEQGSYVFRLTVTDNVGAIAVDDVTVTVNAAANKPPTVDAGADQTITLPLNTVILSGTATDTDGTIAQYAWTKVSGPNDGTFSNPENAATTMTGLSQGTYVLRLTVTDNNGAVASDDVTITVLAAPFNQLPKVDAGPDQNINLPTNSITLKGSATDTDGSIATYQWTKVSGPEGDTLATPDSDSTLVTGLQQGSYVFRLTVTDNKGDTASDDVTVVVSVVTAIGDDPAAASRKLVVAPNPSSNYFSVKLLSASAKPASLQVTDAVGRIVEQRTKVIRNMVFTLGETYRPGVYYVQLVQDGKKLTVKLLKLP